MRDEFKIVFDPYSLILNNYLIDLNQVQKIKKMYFLFNLKKMNLINLKISKKNKNKY